MEFSDRADAVTWTILYGSEPWIDVEIAINNLREEVRERWPDKVWLFDAIYAARWERLREQGWARERVA